jgi:hypothetical protein
MKKSELKALIKECLSEIHTKKGNHYRLKSDVKENTDLKINEQIPVTRLDLERMADIIAGIHDIGNKSYKGDEELDGHDIQRLYEDSYKIINILEKYVDVL